MAWEAVRERKRFIAEPHEMPPPRSRIQMHVKKGKKNWVDAGVDVSEHRDLHSFTSYCIVLSDSPNGRTSRQYSTDHAVEDEKIVGAAAASCRRCIVYTSLLFL